LDHHPPVAKSNHPDLNSAGLVFDEHSGSCLGHFYPGRVQISRTHTAGNIEGQNHGTFHSRQTDDRLRTSQPEQQDGETSQKERRREVATPTGPLRGHFLHQPQPAKTRDQLSSPLLLPRIK
jgi:hypothetical protein